MTTWYWLLLSQLATAEAAEAQNSAQEVPLARPSVLYGVAFTTELVASPGDVCPDGADVPCILGPGVGLTLRGGYRTQSPWTLGGAYELTRHDASNLLRLPLLHQLRFEARYAFELGRRLTPRIDLGGGLALYGSEWEIETAGLVLAVGAGLELELDRETSLGLAVAYRPMALGAFSDEAGQRRADGPLGVGLAHLVALEVQLERRHPLARW